MPHESVDLVIMNPPFTRPTDHESATVPVPPIAGFRAPHEEQCAMAARMAEIRGSLASPIGHCDAGLASNFIELAHAKVGPGGTVAVLLPMTAIQGDSWQPARLLLAECCADVAVVTTASAGSLEEQFGSGRIQAKDQLLGSYIRASLSEGACVALRESALAEVMMSLHGANLALGALGERGLVDRDIGSRNETQLPYRGPFKVVPIQGVPSYPVLWGHAADRERNLVVEPDCAGEVLPDCAERAAEAWKTATRLHFNRDFRLNSQSLAACLTEESVLGGRAWPNFRPKEEAWEEALALWANSTLGLMCFWWAGSRQQQGRVRLTISALPELLVLDPRSVAGDKLERVAEIFENLRGRPLLPANEAFRDQVRVDLDRALLGRVLKLPEEALEALDTVRRQWCSEPSVHDGKRTAPSDGSPE